jgi:diguanylate cyclase (GGDEF)-like protein
MFGSDGTIVGGVEIFSDDSARLETARKLKDMQRMAFLDDLTQLPNRRFVELSLETACNEFRMHRDPFGVLSIDLDGFKGINDFFGHEMGDFALKETAKTLAGALRASDVVGRWGGDEFIAIVRNTSDELLRVLSARCEALVGQTAIPAPNNRKICPSASIGFALARTDEPWKELVARADELMYRRKKAKRSIVA